MRLLNTHSLQLEFFEGGPKAAYAILSHTWGPGEVAFQDLGQPHATALAGWAKITGACTVARREGYRYIWIDTCCIDKTSSAELSEAINSMWKWYASAEVCYAYLADVPFAGFNVEGPEMYTPLERARWFTRGWTLQELLAPAEVVFMSTEWREIGTKESLKEDIAQITSIDEEVLQMRRSISSYSVAQKMAWAAKRRSTRLEDEAYCLMGLFNVNIPLLYGEGQKAFKRLQLAIMTEIYDPTILTWASVDSSMTITGVLAPSPDAFEGCKDITWSPASSLRTSLVGEPKVGHDLIGSSLKMDAAIISLDMMNLDLRAHGEDIDHPQPMSGLGLTSAGILFQNIMHYPKEGSYTEQSSQFDYSLLHSKGHNVSMVILHGCQKRGKHTIGITVCSHQDGSARRIHYPTRFLLPQDWSWAPRSEQKTLYLALSGSEVLAHSKKFFTLLRCLVRIMPAAPDVPYRLSHTIPEKTSDAPNCWYVDRWSDVMDRVTFDQQPAFALRGPGVGRALAFRHVSNPKRSFLIVFTYARCPDLGDRLLVGIRQGEETMASTTQDDLKSILPASSKGPQFSAEFVLDDQWALSVKIRNGLDRHLVILELRDTLSSR